MWKNQHAAHYTVSTSGMVFYGKYQRKQGRNFYLKNNLMTHSTHLFMVNVKDHSERRHAAANSVAIRWGCFIYTIPQTG